MKRTISTNKKLYALFSTLGIDKDTKSDLVHSMTNGRTIHSSEMSEEEAAKLIYILNGKVETTNRRTAELLQQMRRNVFKLMYDCGLIDGNMDNYEKLTIIKNWIANKQNIDKDLNALDFDELTKMIKQLQAVRRNYNERTKKQALYN